VGEWLCLCVVAAVAVVQQQLQWGKIYVVIVSNAPQKRTLVRWRCRPHFILILIFWPDIFAFGLVFFFWFLVAGNPHY